MSAFYEELAATADRLIEKFGQPATLKHTSSAAYSTATGTVTPTAASTTGKIVALQPRQDQVDGSTILATDARLLCSFTTAPAVNDEIAYDSKEQTVVAVMPVSPAGTVVFHEVYVRA